MSSCKIFVMPIFRNIIYLLSAICLISCAVADAFPDQDTIYDNNITMGNFADGIFITDQGLRFNILSNDSGAEIDTVKRAMISCDIVSQVKEDTYNVVMRDFERIFTKLPVDSTAVTDDDIMVENPLHLGEIWYSGGYLNMLISIPVKENSSQVHLINLVRNDEKATSGVYEFTFKHNAFGETISENDIDFSQANTYVSFPLAQLFKEDEKTVQIIINWTSNVETDGVLGCATQRNKTTLDIERTGYEHKHWE